MMSALMNKTKAKKCGVHWQHPEIPGTITEEAAGGQRKEGSGVLNKSDLTKLTRPIQGMAPPTSLWSLLKSPLKSLFN